MTAKNKLIHQIKKLLLEVEQNHNKQVTVNELKKLLELALES